VNFVKQLAIKPWAIENYTDRFTRAHWETIGPGINWESQRKITCEWLIGEWKL